MGFPRYLWDEFPNILAFTCLYKKHTDGDFHRSGLAKLRELYNRIGTVKRSWRVKQSSMYYTETAVFSPLNINR